jgi:IclR family pca regulon transcriptional regulator
MSESSDMEKNPLFSTSLEKGLRVLGAFHGKNNSMSLREVAEASGMTKSSAQRIIFTLEKLGMVRRGSKTGKFQLGLRTMELGFNYLSGDFLVEAGSPFLSELTNVTGETTNMTEPDGFDMVYVSRVASSKFIPLHLAIGSRIPMYCTGSGRAYLSALPIEEARGIVEGSALVAHTQWTVTQVDAIMDSIIEAKREGYAYNKEEFFLGDMTIAAPIMGGSGRPVGAVHVVAPTSRWTLEDCKAKLAPAVLEAARGISSIVRPAT